LNPKIFDKLVEAHSRKIEDKDRLNWLLGQYLLVAYHKPKEYPKKPFSQKKELKIMSSKEIERKLKALLKISNKINKNDN
jgi:hypothetical protein